MRKVKKVARFLMELILAITLIGYILASVLSKTILNEGYVLAKLDKLGYYDKIYELTKANFEKYISQSGLDEKILENIVTKEQVEEDTKKILSNIYEGSNHEISTEELKSNLRNNINNQVKIDSLNKEQKKSIEDFVETVSKEYKATISSTGYETNIYSRYKQFNKYSKLTKKVAIILVGVCLIAIVLLNLRRNYKIFTNIGIALLSTGVVLTIFNIYINTKLKIGYITILNEPVSIFVRSTLGDIFSSILKYGILGIVFGILMMAIANVVHNIWKYKALMEENPQDNE